jgi:putative alpha-1,2-mannosidase
LFREAEVDMGGKRLRIEAENYAPENLYVDKVRLNDTILNRTWIRHSEIAEGGVLIYEMSDKPDIFK